MLRELLLCLLHKHMNDVLHRHWVADLYVWKINVAKKRTIEQSAGNKIN